MNFTILAISGEYNIIFMTDCPSDDYVNSKVTTYVNTKPFLDTCVAAIL